MKIPPKGGFLLLLHQRRLRMWTDGEIEKLYNEDLDVKIVSGCMRCSVEKVYYLKRRVIKKTRKLLTL
jgi:hypothetical protein